MIAIDRPENMSRSREELPTLHARIPEKGHRKKGPYEAYFRQQQRLHRIQVAIVVGTLFLVIITISLAVAIHVTGDTQVAQASGVYAAHD